MTQDKLQDEQDWNDIKGLMDKQHEEQHCKVSKIEETTRMASEVEDLLLPGVSDAGKDPQDALKPSAPSWYPDIVHCSETKIDFPASYLNYSDGFSGLKKLPTSSTAEAKLLNSSKRQVKVCTPTSLMAPCLLD